MNDENKLVLECHLNGKWNKIADLTAIGDTSKGINCEISLEYDLDWASEYLGNKADKALSVLHAVDYEQKNLEKWPSFLLDFLPQGAVLKYIEKYYGIQATPSQEWNILKKVPIMPPGNLRIAPSQGMMAEVDSHAGFEKSEVVDRSSDFLEYMVERGAPIGGSTGAQGAAPKLLLREDYSSKFHAEAAISDKNTKRLWLVKFPRGNKVVDYEILACEALYQDIARTLGHTVEGSIHHESGTLFFERFDRKITQNKILYFGLESFYSAIGSTIHGQRVDHVVYLDMLHKFSRNREIDIIEYYLRELTREAFGDTDNHGRNSSLIKIDNEIRLSPLYDFAPMQFDEEMIVRQSFWDKELSDAQKIIEFIEDRYNLHGALISKLKDYRDRLEDINSQESVTKDFQFNFIEKTKLKRELILRNINSCLQQRVESFNIYQSDDNIKFQKPDKDKYTVLCQSKICKNPNGRTRLRGNRRFLGICSHCER
ncbi:MAG: type II toxin-antitoxin system HipA family toxin [Oligoflexus sp.]